MKITKFLCINILVIFGLSGCIYGSANLIRVQGTDVDVTINPLLNSYTLKGKQLAATIFREGGISKKNKDGSTEKLIPMPDISEEEGKWKLDNAPQNKDK